MLAAVFTLSCVSHVIALAILEEQNLVPDDSLQDLTSRTKKSPDLNAQEPYSESDIKNVLTQDIKTKIGDLKELKSAYKQVVTDFFGNSENSDGKITPEKSALDSNLNGETLEDVDSIRNPRQYYSDRYDNLGYNSENEPRNSYSDSSQNSHDNSEDPYIASSYNPDAKTFNFGNFQAGFQLSAEKKSETAKTHSKPSHVEYVPYYYPVVPEYQQVVQPVYSVVKPEITIKPVVVKPIYKPITVKPVEIKPIEIKPHKPIEIKPIEIKPPKPIEIKPPRPIEIRPVVIKPVHHHHKPAVIQTPTIQPQVQYQPVHQDVQSPIYFKRIEKGWPGKFFSKQIIFGPSADFGTEHNYYPTSYSYPSTFSYPSAETYTPAFYPQGYSYDTPSYSWYPQDNLQTYSYGQNVYPQGYYNQQAPGFPYYSQNNVNYPQNNINYPQNNGNYPQNNVNYPYANIYRSTEDEKSSYRDELDNFLTQLLEVENKTLSQEQTLTPDQLKAEIEKEKKTIKFLEENSSTDYDEMLGFDGRGFNVENIVDWLSGEMEDIHERWESLKNEFRKPAKATGEEATQDVKNEDVKEEAKQ